MQATSGLLLCGERKIVLYCDVSECVRSDMISEYVRGLLRYIIIVELECQMGGFGWFWMGIKWIKPLKSNNSLNSFNKVDIT